MDASKIQAAGAQYAMGFTTKLGPSAGVQRPSMTAGTRQADGFCADFYDEGWEDAARGTRVNLNQYPSTFVAKVGGRPKFRAGSATELEPEAELELELLAELRSAVGENTHTPSEGLVAAIGCKVAELVKRHNDADEEGRALRRMKDREEARARKAAEDAAAAEAAAQAEREALEFAKFKKAQELGIIPDVVLGDESPAQR